MKKALAGAVIGFFACGLLTLVVVTARFYTDDNPLNHAVSLALIFCPFGAVPGLVIGAVVGAVIGSGRKAKPDSSSSGMACPQQGVVSPSYTKKQQLGQAKCPFCHSATFRVVEEVGLRRCSDCHSVLPNYILGNRQLADVK